MKFEIVFRMTDGKEYKVYREMEVPLSEFAVGFFDDVVNAKNKSFCGPFINDNKWISIKADEVVGIEITEYIKPEHDKYEYI